MPHISDENGTLSLFRNMEETKLCYLLIKQEFQVNYLGSIGIELMALGNDFEKFGKQSKEVDEYFGK